MRCQRATRRRIDHLTDSPEILDVLVESQRGEQIVFVISEWISDGALVAVVSGEVKNVVELVGDPGQDGVGGNRPLEEVDTRIPREVLALGRQEIVDYDKPSTPLSQRRPDQVAADEASSADHQEALTLHRPVHQSPRRVPIFSRRSA